MQLALIDYPFAQFRQFPWQRDIMPALDLLMDKSECTIIIFTTFQDWFALYEIFRKRFFCEKVPFLVIRDHRAMYKGPAHTRSINKKMP